MNNNNKFLLFLGLYLITCAVLALANQDEPTVQLNDNEVVVNVSFESTEQFSGLRESSSTKKQMVVQFNDWQTLVLDRYVLKFKISEPLSEQDDKHFMIETQILNSQQDVIYSPSLLSEPDKKANIEISGKTNLEPSFNASFTLLLK